MLQRGFGASLVIECSYYMQLQQTTMVLLGACVGAARFFLTQFRQFAHERPDGLVVKSESTRFHSVDNISLTDRITDLDYG